VDMVSAKRADRPESKAAPRIVGLGASAGGLVALEQFLAHTPANSGLAYIVVQHLDPTQKALLPELLQRATSMVVREARDGMRIERDCVYVIPSDAELTVTGSRLRVASPHERRGMRLPINILFSSMASVLGERSIAVVLSGMGADGTLGLQAIKAVGGLTLVQDPGSAQFDSMPKSAITAGCADIVAPVVELPARILDCVAGMRRPTSGPDDSAGTEPESTVRQRLLSLLQQRTGHDFSLYKDNTLNRRIERRMAIHAISSTNEYVQFLERNAQEIDLLFKELLIGVTSFFRDPEVWDHLVQVALPGMLDRKADRPALRAWVIGCSTGEEAYSLAIAFRESVQRLSDPEKYTLQIFATDLGADAIATARKGIYPLSIASDVSSERLSRFFDTHEAHYEIKKSIRDMVLFAHHDVILDPPFTKIDILSCRNLLIYFDAALQRRLLPLFHYSLRADGLLVLGTSETIGHFTHLFAPVQPKLRLYVRENGASGAGADFMLTSFPPLSLNSKEPRVPPPNGSTSSNDGLQAAADHLLLQVYAPAAVVVNSDADIVYISGRTGNYLEPAAGKANWNFHAMIREGLREPLVDALRRAQRQSEPLQLHGLRVALSGGARFVDVTVQVLHDPAPLRGMTMVVFRDVGSPSKAKGRRPGKDSEKDSSEADLQQYRAEIVALREEARASREELQSANEELQSTNEELQSTNEELTTSKEEMQSMNEELQTINSELQAKLDDLALEQSDMKNLLNSIEIAILFLDQDLNVRRFTDRAAKVINLRETDVGRPLSDLTTTLQYSQLHEDANETLRSLVPSEKQILSDDNLWFAVRIMPYRRLDNVIDGVVITLVDITATKRLEAELRNEPGEPAV
jgi:two-component system, chemotaxis family, CheB/CheR fusion protein